MSSLVALSQGDQLSKRADPSSLLSSESGCARAGPETPGGTAFLTASTAPFLPGPKFPPS